MFCFFFFFNDTATTEIYTLSLHDALPISSIGVGTWWLGATIGFLHGLFLLVCVLPLLPYAHPRMASEYDGPRSEEHTSELQSQSNLVCRLLLEKKKKRLTQLYSHSANSDD